MKIKTKRVLNYSAIPLNLLTSKQHNSAFMEMMYPLSMSRMQYKGWSRQDQRKDVSIFLIVFLLLNYSHKIRITKF